MADDIPPSNCGICAQNINEDDELICDVCRNRYHLQCGTGCMDPHAEIQTCINKFTCPLCLVGRDNALIHKVLTINQLYNAEKSQPVVDFRFSSSLLSNKHDADDESSQSDSSRSAESVKSASSKSIREKKKRDKQRLSAEHSDKRRSRAKHSEPGELSDSDHGDKEFIELHKSDRSRVSRLSKVLNSTNRLPNHVNTLILIDSLGKGMDGRELDPVNDNIALRMAGGVCTVAAVHALKKRTTVNRRIKKFVLAVSVNSILHKDQHCSEEQSSYFKALYGESKRLYPSATVHLVPPYSGSDKIPKADIEEFMLAVKDSKAPFKIHFPPNMRGKLDRDNVHLSEEGRESYRDFFAKHFASKSISGSKSNNKYTGNSSQFPPLENTAGGDTQRANHPVYKHHQGHSKSNKFPVHYSRSSSTNEENSLTGYSAPMHSAGGYSCPPSHFRVPPHQFSANMYSGHPSCAQYISGHGRIGGQCTCCNNNLPAGRYPYGHN